MSTPETPYDPASEGARMSFKDAMSYGDYLRLDAVLSAQVPIVGRARRAAVHRAAPDVGTVDEACDP